TPATTRVLPVTSGAPMPSCTARSAASNTTRSVGRIDRPTSRWSSSPTTGSRARWITGGCRPVRTTVVGWAGCGSCRIRCELSLLLDLRAEATQQFRLELVEFAGYRAVGCSASHRRHPFRRPHGGAELAQRVLAPTDEIRSVIGGGSSGACLA